MKIIITGSSNIDKLAIAKKIISKSDEFSIANYFTSNEEYKDKVSENYIMFLNPNAINLAYKNNAFLFILTENYISTGITLDEFYTNNIICVSNKTFNLITNNIFANNECLVIWVDSKQHDNIDIKSELREINYLEKTLKEINYLYFLDEDINFIADTIISYVNGNEDKRKELLLEYC